MAVRATWLCALAVAACDGASASRLVSSRVPIARAAPARRSAVRACDAPGPHDAIAHAGGDLNLLATLLTDAIECEDFVTAAAVRDEIRRCAGKGDDASTLQGWSALGAPEWLAARAERLGFHVPTPVQRQAFQALGGTDAVIRSQTGSGKTLAYLMPMLAALSDGLLEEDVANYLRTHLERSGLPSPGRAESARALGDRERATGAPLAVIVVATRELGVQVALLAYQLCGGNRNPQLQPYAHPKRFEPGARTNMFKYSGPRHVRIAGCWDDESLNASMPVADYGLDALKDAHVVVGTPACLAAVARRGHVALSNARFVVVDEADACMRVPRAAAGLAAELPAAPAAAPPSAEGVALDDIFGAHAPLPPRSLGYDWERLPQRRVLVGASIDSAQVERAAAQGWLGPSPALVVEGGEVAPSARTFPSAQTVPSHLRHAYVEVEPEKALGALVRLVRKALLDYEGQTEGQTGAREAAAASGGGGRALQRPRMIVFCRDGETAVRIAAPLQSTLWSGLGGDIDAGLCGLSVLLPSAEDAVSAGRDNSTVHVQESSLRILEMFSVGQTNLLVTTVGATRGLDFANVTHVFNLGVVGQEADYVHRAGRAGRIGHRTRGVVTSVVDARGAAELVALGDALGFTPEREEVPLGEEYVGVSEGQGGTDEQVRYLEDLLQLYSGVDAADSLAAAEVARDDRDADASGPAADDGGEQDH